MLSELHTYTTGPIQPIYIVPFLLYVFIQNKQSTQRQLKKTINHY